MSSYANTYDRVCQNLRDARRERMSTASSIELTAIRNYNIANAGHRVINTTNIRTFSIVNGFGSHEAVVAAQPPTQLYNIEQQATDDDDDGDTPRCVVCLSAKPQVVAVPCGHTCVCCTCYTKLAESAGDTAIKCPVCREPTTSGIVPRAP